LLVHARLETLSTKRTERMAHHETIDVTLPDPLIDCLEAMRKTGLFGLTTNDVASYLITRQIDDMMRAKSPLLPASMIQP